VNLQPLVCPTCAGAVPLGEGATTRCPYCAAEAPIPPAYLKMRDEDRAQIAARAEAAALIAELAAPLPAPIRAFALVGKIAGYVALGIFVLAFVLGFFLAMSEGGGGGVLTLIFAVFVALLSVPIAWEWALHALADTLHVDVVDRMSGFGAHLLLGVFVVVFFLVPLVLGYYARSIIAARSRLQRMFRSKPPARPGGPATCRHCDAPLDVATGALGARCLYCGTDNLVSLSPDVVKAAVVASTKSYSAIGEALGEQATARFYLKARLKALAVLAVLVAPLVAGLGLVTEVVMDEGGAPGHLTRASGTPMLYGEGKRRAQGDVALDCSGDCVFYVPLARGQTLVAHGGDSRSLQRRDIGPWYHLDWWSWTELEAGPVRHTGWYRLVVRASQGQKLTWSVE